MRARQPDRKGFVDRDGVKVSASAGAYWHLVLAAEHPERVDGSVFIAPALPLAPRHTGRDINFNAHHADDDGWHKFNRHSG